MFLKANNIAFDTDPTPEQLEVAREKACVEMWEEREALEGDEAIKENYLDLVMICSTFITVLRLSLLQVWKRKRYIWS